MKELKILNNAFKQLITSILISSVIVFLLSGCRNDPGLTPTERRMADSIFNLRSKEMLPELETICDSVYNQSYLPMVDSIKKVRQEEVIRLLEK